MSRKLIITEDLKKVLLQIKNNTIASFLLLNEIDDSILNHPEKEFNYIDLSHATKGHLSYLTKDKIEKIEASENKDYWEVKIRYHSRPGSLMKKMFKINDVQIESFTTQLQSIIDPPVYTMKVVQSDDIAKYYSHYNHAQPYGSLGNSCMNSSPREYFDIYVNNPEQINMLVMFDKYEKVMGRAILWNGDGFKLLDRIYICNDNYLTYFYNWAKENNCYYKEQNTWNTPQHLMFNNEKVFKKIEITLNKTKFDKYPYLDTFKWLDRMYNKVYNYIPDIYKSDKYLHEYDGDMIVISDHLGGYFDRNYFGFCEMTRYCVDKNSIVHLDYLGMDVYNGNTVKSYTLNKLIYKEHAIINDEIRDYIFIPEFDKFNDVSLIKDKKKELEEKKKIGEKMKTGLFGSTDYGKGNDDYWASYNPYSQPVRARIIEDLRAVRAEEVTSVIQADCADIQAECGLYNNGNFLSSDEGDFFDNPREDEKEKITVECDTWVEDTKNEKIEFKITDLTWKQDWMDKTTGYIN